MWKSRTVTAYAPQTSHHIQTVCGTHSWTTIDFLRLHLYTTCTLLWFGSAHKLLCSATSTNTQHRPSRTGVITHKHSISHIHTDTGALLSSALWFVHRQLTIQARYEHRYTEHMKINEHIDIVCKRDRHTKYTLYSVTNISKNNITKTIYARFFLHNENSLSIFDFNLLWLCTGSGTIQKNGENSFSNIVFFCFS